MSERTWSRPETDVMARALEFVEAGELGVVATVVAVEGNAFRRPGARMVVTADGTGVGAVTAGCLEDEVLGVASDVLETGEPRLETYDLMEDDDDVWGLGMGCNGIIDILVEPLDERLRPVLEAYAAGEPIGVVTLLEEFERAHYRPGGGFGAAPGSDPLPGAVADALRDTVADLVEEGTATTVEVGVDGDRVRAFVDGVAPPPELVVCGTGHDVRPVVELARRADFRVTVVGFRGASASEERFPAADDVVSTSPDDLLDAYDPGFDRRTYAVVMTHNLVDDLIAVERLLESPTPYVGIMGPRERFEKLRSEGLDLDDADLERVYTPVGLDLGGGTPHQIAISVVGEMLAVHNDRRPRHLRDRKGPMHDRPGIEGGPGE